MMLKKVIFIAGIQRSGNHAIRNWIEHQFNGPLIYRNDCHFLLYGKAAYPTRLFDGNVETKIEVKKEDISRYQAYILGIENPSIEYHENTRNFYMKQVEEFGYPEVRCLYLIRNPFNMIASMWKMWGNKEKIIKICRLWSPLANELKGNTSFLDDSLGERMVEFDKWVMDENYRRDLSAFCGIEFNDKGKKNVMGSSFGSRDLDSINGKNELMNRYRIFENDPGFVDLVRSIPGLLDAASGLFEIPSAFKGKSRTYV